MHSFHGTDFYLSLIREGINATRYFQIWLAAAVQVISSRGMTKAFISSWPTAFRNAVTSSMTSGFPALPLRRSPGHSYKGQR